VPESEQQCAEQTGPPPETAASPLAALRRSLDDEAVAWATSEFHDLFENAPVAYFELDTAGLILRANQAACRLLGYARQRLEGNSSFDFLDPADRDAARMAMSQRVSGGGDDHPFRRDLRRADGSKLLVEIYENVIRDSAGQVIGVRNTLLDVTRRVRAEEALARSEAQFRQVWDRSQDGMRITDANGMVLLANQAYCRLVGLRRQEVEGRPFFAAYLPSERERVAAAYRERFQRGVFPEHMLRLMPLRDGREVWMSITNSVIELEYERAVLSVCRDATQEKRAAEALRAQEERFQAVVRNADAVIFTLDRDGVFTLSEGLGLRALGLQPGEVVGRSAFELYADVDTITDGIRRALAGECCNRENSVQGLTFQTIYSPLRDATGAICGVAGIATDVTRFKQTLVQLEASERRFRQLAVSSQDAIIVLDEEAQVTFWNASAERMFGYLAAEAVGRRLHEFLVPPEWKQAASEGWRRFHHSGRGRLVGQVTEVEALRSDGSRFPVEASIAAFELDGHWHAVGTVRDITSRKRAEEALVSAKESAESAARAKSAFVASMSHEIRTPMNGILGMAGLLRDTRLTEEQSNYLESIQSSAEALLTLINDILDFSKIEAGKLHLTHASFDLRAVLGELVTMMAPLAAAKGLECALIYPSGAPRCFDGDAGRVRQVVLNLLGNAIKFTQQGGIHVEVGVATGEGGPHDVRIAVHDTGIGIPEAKRHLLFQEFTQMDASIRREFGGTGLGLAISKRLVEAMGGEIGVHSVEGEGSEFFIRLSLAPAQAPAAPPPAEPPPGEFIQGAALRRFPGRSALLVEDNRVSRTVGAAFLRKLGFEVHLAGNGEEALSAAAAQRFDVILMDCQMPRMDGFEATSRLRQREAGGPRSLIIALTAHAMEGDRAQCLAAGMDDYLSKPVNIETMCTVLERWLG
jgi:PAS domain S-box-containing protein